MKQRISRRGFIMGVAASAVAPEPVRTFHVYDHCSAYPAGVGAGSVARQIMDRYRYIDSALLWAKLHNSIYGKMGRPNPEITPAITAITKAYFNGT